MKIGKKLISLLLILCMVILLVPTAFGAESGTCGEKAKWILENGILVVSGSGDMADYASPEETPWASWRDNIDVVIFYGAITRIGNNAFADCPNLEHVTFSTATITIGDRAFYNCKKLASADYQEPSGENGEENNEENGDVGDTDIPGDVNGDGEVDGRDVIRLMKFLAEETDEETGEVVKINEKNSDLNQDGEVNELDLLRLLKALVEDGILIQPD